MKKTTNAYQEAYIIAKAHFEAVESQQAEMERKYIADNGIVNSDGSVPKWIYCIEDDAVFEKANEEFSSMIVASGLEAERNKAFASLKAAEDRLIAYGISLAPAGIRENLQRAVKKDYGARENFLDHALRLDASTVPAGM